MKIKDFLEMSESEQQCHTPAMHEVDFCGAFDENGNFIVRLEGEFIEGTNKPLIQGWQVARILNIAQISTFEDYDEFQNYATRDTEFEFEIYPDDYSPEDYVYE